MADHRIPLARGADHRGGGDPRFLRRASPRMSAPLLRDARALPVTAASPAAVAALDDTIAAFCGLRLDPGDRLKRALAADPQLVMAHILKGNFLLLFARRDFVGRAVKAAEAAKAAIAAVGAMPRGGAPLA